MAASCPLPFLYGYRWDQNRAGVGFVTPYIARRVAWSVGVSSIALLLAALILYLIDRSQIALPESVGLWGVFTGIDIAVNIPVPLLGILIASRRPRNPIGWVYLGASFALGVVIFGQLYAIHVLVVDPGALPGGHVMAWISVLFLPVAICLLPFLFLLFPTGRLPSRRWRPVAWLSAAVLICLTVGSGIFAAQIWSRPFVGPRKPQRARCRCVVTVFFAAALTSRSPCCCPSHLGGSVPPFEGRRKAAAEVVRRRGGRRRRHLQPGVLLRGGYRVGGRHVSRLFLDIAIALAVLKYRLYDIDILIGRGLRGTRSLHHRGVCAARRGDRRIHRPTEGLAPCHGDRRGGLPTGAHAGPGLANRLVYGKRATPYEVLSEFSERVGEAYSVEDVLPRMARLLAEGTGASTEVWLRVGSELRPAATWPEGGAPPAPETRLDDAQSRGRRHEHGPVRHQGVLLGALTGETTEGASRASR